MERLAQETGSYEELAAVYEQVADELPKGPLAERLYLVLARVQDRNLDDPGEAEAALRKILEFDPTNASALDAMAQMFGRRGRDRELIVSLEQKLEAAPSIEARKAHLPGDRPHPPRAAEGPGGGGERPHPCAGARGRTWRRSAELAAALPRPAHVGRPRRHPRPHPRPPPHRRGAGADCRSRSPRSRRRRSATRRPRSRRYREALELDPRNAEALDALERLYTRLDRPADLLAIYERQLELTEDYREKVKILFHSAAIWEDRYQNPANADACIEGVLALDPTNLQAIKALERLRRAQGRWEDLVGVLERHIQLATDAEEQADLMVETGEVLRTHLHQTDKAADAFQAALGVDPRPHPGAARAGHALRAERQLALRPGDAPPGGRGAGARPARGRGAPPDGEDQRGHAAGRVLGQGLLRRGPADRPRVPAVAPGAPGHLRERAGLGRATSRRWSPRPRRPSEASAKARAYLDVGRYHSERREDPDSAMHWYEEAIKLDPELADAALPLSDLYIARERWEPAEQMLDVVIRSLKGRLRHRAGRRARQGPLPAGLPDGLRRRRSWAGGTARSPRTRRPTSSTPPTSRRSRATATSWSRPAGTTRRSRSSRPSSSTTART